MLRVMIVDDELMARAKVKAAMADIEDVYVDQEAVNGEDALKQMKERMPDIVLVDMRIPVMNGTEFIRRAKQLYPNIAILALSGYEDYVYVRDSMKYGALDYILKHELTTELLRDGLELCKAEIQQNEYREQENLRVDRQRQSAQQLARRQSVLQILQGNLANPREVAAICGFDSDRHMFQVTVMQIDDFQQYEKSNGRVATIMMHSIITSIAQEAINQYGTGIIESLENGAFVIILAFEKMLNYRYAGDISRQLIRVLGQNLSKYTSLTASFSVGSGVVPLHEISLIYRKALQHISLRYLKGKNTVVSTDMPVQTSDFVSLSDEEAQTLNEMLAAGDMKACTAAVNRVFDRLIDSNASKPSCQIICIELLNMLLHSVTACPLNDELKTMLERYKRDILTYDSIDESRQALQKATGETVSFLAERKQLEKYNRHTIKAIEYIQTHYRDDVSLDTVAHHLNVNKSYLSRTFSADCGVSLTEYVTTFRLDKAQLLLKNGVSIAETADAVGIDNMPYFFRLFKRHTGRTPQSYQPREDSKQEHVNSGL